MARRRAPLAPAAEAEQAESIVSEREAAAKFNALRPGLSMGCLKPLGERQGCSAADGRREGFACCLSASSIWCRRPDLEQARSFASEREAAAKIGTHRPKISVVCLKPLGERQGCSAADGRREGFACCLFASFV